MYIYCVNKWHKGRITMNYCAADKLFSKYLSGLKCVGVRFWQETVLHVNFQATSKRPWNNAVKPAISTWCQLHSYTDSSSETLCTFRLENSVDFKDFY